MSRRLLAILRDCENQGVHLSANGSGLEVRGSSTPELREDLKKHKLNVLTYLRTGLCHHELEPEVCAVCSGYVLQMIEELKDRDRTTA